MSYFWIVTLVRSFRPSVFMCSYVMHMYVYMYVCMYVISAREYYFEFLRSAVFGHSVHSAEHIEPPLDAPSAIMGS